MRRGTWPARPLLALALLLGGWAIDTGGSAAGDADLGRLGRAGDAGQQRVEVVQPEGLLRKPSQPLLLANLQEAAASRDSSTEVRMTTAGGAADDVSDGLLAGEWQGDAGYDPADEDVAAAGQGRQTATAGMLPGATTPPRLLEVVQPQQPPPAESFGARLLGGLRGHLFEQLRAKGRPLPQHDPAYAGAAAAGPPSPEAVQDLWEAEEGEDDDLSSWWPVGSHLQPLVRPFVEKREIRPPGSVARQRGGVTDWAAWLAGRGGQPQPIPRIFHQVYVAGEAALAAAEAAAEGSPERWPPVKAAWRAACRRLHPDWEFRLWDLAAMRALLEERYAWFLPTFDAYPQLIHKVDAVRPFIMHAHGGVYADVDTECLRPVDGFLEEHELVFQEEDFGAKSLVNSAVAGVPGHAFWRVWQQVIWERAPQLQRRRPWLARADSAVIAVLNATGPWALRSAFQRFSRDYGQLHTSYIGAWRVNETNVMVYPLGTWFVPCLWNNVECHDAVEQLARAGKVPLWLAGHHKNAGSWFKAAGFQRPAAGGRRALGLLAAAAAAAAALLVCGRCLRRRRGRRRGREAAAAAALLRGRVLGVEQSLDKKD